MGERRSMGAMVVVGGLMRANDEEERWRRVRSQVESSHSTLVHAGNTSVPFGVTTEHPATTQTKMYT